MLQTTYKKVVDVLDESPSGSIDGTNKIYVSSSPIKSGTLSVYYNGVRQREGSGNDYIVLNINTIEMEFAPLPGDELTIDYTKLY